MDLKPSKTNEDCRRWKIIIIFVFNALQFSRRSLSGIVARDVFFHLSAIHINEEKPLRGNERECLDITTDRRLSSSISIRCDNDTKNIRGILRISASSWSDENSVDAECNSSENIYILFAQIFYSLLFTDHGSSRNESRIVFVRWFDNFYSVKLFLEIWTWS